MRRSALRLHFRTGRAGRPAVAPAALRHELVGLRFVLGVPQALQKFLELALLLLEPAQRFGAVFVERPIPARPVRAAAPAARGALGLVPPPAGAGAVMSASHPTAP